MLIPRDAKIVIAATSLRSYVFGYLIVLHAIYLAGLGFNALDIGILITMASLSSAILSLGGSLLADRYGRKNSLILFGSLMTIGSALYVVTSNYFLLIFASMIGLIGSGSGAGGVSGPFGAIQQALLADETTEKERNSVFSINSFIATLASSLGALSAGLPIIFEGLLLLDLLDAQRSMFALAAGLGIVYVAVVSFIHEPRRLKPKRILPVKSSRVILKFSTFRAFDGLGAGTFNFLLAYWFFVRYNVDLAELAIVFALSELLAAIAMLAAGKLADRFGSLNAIVATHIPAIAMTVLLPFAPEFGIAAGLMIARMIFGSMDIPLKQAYLMSIVSPEERASAAGITNLVTLIPQSIGATVTGYLFQFVSLASPFFVSGLLKTGSYSYLYFAFRNVKPIRAMARND